MTKSTDGMVKIFSQAFLDELSVRAGASPRLRQNHNIHDDFSDPCQRFFNAMEPGSYLRPHRQAMAPRSKLLISVRGQFLLLLFDDAGTVTQSLRFGVGSRVPMVGAEVPPGIWNTVVALESASILLEVKAGPFDPDGPREPAPWAPGEGAAEANQYLDDIRRKGLACSSPEDGPMAQ